MYGKIFLRVADVMEILGVSENYAYKLIRKLNKEMQEMGFQTIQGRIDTKFFYEHFYQTKDYESLLIKSQVIFEENFKNPI